MFRCRLRPSGACLRWRPGSWMIVVIGIDMARRFRIPDTRFLAATALGCVVAMLAAGMAEYNFGDSEFLMLFLVLMTLPYAARPGREEQSITNPSLM